MRSDTPVLCRQSSRRITNEPPLKANVARRPCLATEDPVSGPCDWQDISAELKAG
jgi:hypothetical protein